MFVVTEVQLFIAKWSYLTHPSTPGDGGGAPHHINGALENEVDLAHRLLWRSALCDIATLVALPIFASFLPGIWFALVWAVGSYLVLKSAARDTLSYAPSLPKLDHMVRVIATHNDYAALTYGYHNLPSATLSTKQPDALIQGSSELFQLPPLLRHHLLQACKHGAAERLTEVCQAVLLNSPNQELPCELFQAQGLVQAQHIDQLKRQGRYFGLLPPERGAGLMYAGMPFPSSLLPELLAPRPGQAEDAQDRPLLLGFGAAWSAEQQRQTELLLSDGRTVRENPHINGVDLFQRNLGAQGFNPIELPSFKADLHCLVTGTTGSGKTTMLNLLVCQSILNGHPTIVIDPKGDPTLKQMLVASLEQSGRDPLRELKCCDFLMEAAPEPYDEKRQHFERCYYGPTALPDLSKSNQTIFGAKPYPKGPAYAQDEEELDKLCALEQSKLDHDLLWLTNVGINPLGDEHSSVEQMAEVLCSNLSRQGQAASFTAQTERVMVCAIYCAQELERQVTIDHIYQHYCKRESMEQALRCLLNRYVEKQDDATASIFYNRLHGFKSADLVELGIKPEHALGCAFLVRYVLGAKLTGTPTPAKLKQGIERLQADGLLSPHQPATEVGDKTTAEEEPLESPEEEAEQPPKSRSKRSAKSEGASGASIAQLLTFYDWLSEHHYPIQHIASEMRVLRATITQDQQYLNKVAAVGQTIFTSFDNERMRALLSNGTGQNVTISSIINSGHVLYLNLSTLRQSSAARLVGTMVLRALAQHAAQRIETSATAKLRPGKLTTVDIFIDEASTLTSETLLDLLNKTRAAKYHIALFTQSIEDFYRSDSKASCEHLIANCNVHIALRSLDQATAAQMAQSMGTIKQSQRSSSLGGFDSPNDGMNLSSSHNLNTKDIALFAASYLGLLPDFEFVARLPSGRLYKGLIPRLTPSSLQRVIASSKRYDLGLQQRANERS